MQGVVKFPFALRPGNGKEELVELFDGVLPERAVGRVVSRLVGWSLWGWVRLCPLWAQLAGELAGGLGLPAAVRSEWQQIMGANDRLSVPRRKLYCRTPGEHDLPPTSAPSHPSICSPPMPFLLLSSCTRPAARLWRGFRQCCWWQHRRPAQMRLQAGCEPAAVKPVRQSHLDADDC